MSANATTWNITWIAMTIIFIVIVLVAVAVVIFDTDTQCEREANGYPLTSFPIDGTGDEIECRYGIHDDELTPSGSVK